MARIHGSHGQVKMDPTGVGGATAVVVASLNKWSLDLARDKADVTCFGDTNKQYVQGLPDIKGAVGGFWDSATTPSFFKVALGEVAAFFDLIPSSLEPTFLFKGLGYVDASIEVDAGGAVSISGNLVGAGPWTMEPVVP